MSSSSHTSLPDGEAIPSVPEAVVTAPDDDARPLKALPEASRPSVRRLYERVEQSVETIQRLRAENERLRERVEELEERPSFPDDKTVVALDDDPDSLRDRITEFIDVIDAYLDAVASDEETENQASP